MDTFARIESAAHDGAFGLNGYPLPDDAQKRSGDYLKGRVDVHGLPIVIEQPRNSFREGVGEDGKPWRTRLAAHYGYIDGVPGADGDEMDVMLGPVPESTRVYVVNQLRFGTQDFDEHKCMIGYPDATMAKDAYMQSFTRGWSGFGSMTGCTIEQFRTWLSTGDTTAPLTPDSLSLDGTAMDNLTWDDNAQPVGMSIADVLYNLRQIDPDGLILDPMAMSDVSDEAEGEIALDALVVPYAQLGRKMAQLQRVLQQASAGPAPAGMTISKPFKLRGVINVAVIYELTDGQTITIWFHSAGANANRVQSGDELVSWRWALNKKDITILVAKENGQELLPRQIARRVMAVATRNSARFAQINANRAERLNSIDALKSSLNEKIATLESTSNDVHTLTQKVAERKAVVAAKAAAKALPAQVQTPVPGQQDANQPHLFVPAVAMTMPTHQPHEEVAGVVPDGQPTAATPIPKLPEKEEATLRELGASAADIRLIAATGSYAAFASDIGNQDICDHLMGARIVEVRNALRELGWDGERYGDLSRSVGDATYTLDIDLKPSASTYNVTNFALRVQVTQPDAAAIPPRGVVPNDMSKSAAELAFEVDSMISGPAELAHNIQTEVPAPEAEQAAEPEPAEEDAAAIDAKAIANTILKQLGGSKFQAMTGARYLVILPEGGLQFSIPAAKGGINLVTVTLNGADTYDLVFYRKRGVTMKEVTRDEDVPAEDMPRLVSEETGLAISLGAPKAEPSAEPAAVEEPIAGPTDTTLAEQQAIANEDPIQEPEAVPANETGEVPTENEQLAEAQEIANADPVQEHLENPDVAVEGNEPPLPPISPELAAQHEESVADPVEEVQSGEVAPETPPLEPLPEELAAQQAIASAEPLPDASESDDGDAERTTDTEFMQSVIDGTADMFDMGMAERLESIMNRYEGDDGMMLLFNSAANAYSGHMVDQARAAMA